MPLTPSSAAKRAGVSRSLISRAAKSGELKATKRNNGHLSIEEADLDDWMSRRTQRDSHPAPDPAPAETVTRHADDERIAQLTAELSEVRQQLARAEGTAEATADRIADMSRQIEATAADRDAWRQQAERLAEASKPGPGLLARIFKR